ncbi:hypothetical protein EDB84DRAFT_1522488 [Lactarius hengduanensis]|nr:hypothetical protein EDB84DRAFT_1522488 [Lactarius hengduanensis]
MRKGGGWRALACLHPAHTGRGANGEGMPPSCAYGAVRPKGCRGCRALVRPFMGREGPEREGGRRQRALVRTPSVGMGGAAKGKGWEGRGERRRRTLVPTPSVRMGREVPGREGEVGGADRGQGGLGVTARRGSGMPTRVLPHGNGHGGKGGGGRRALVRRLSARMRWRGQRVREGGRHAPLS